MKYLYLLATNKPSRLYLVKDKLKLSPLKFTNDEEVGWLTQNIYITSDEEITGFENNIWVIKGQRVFLWQNTMALVSNNKPRKIILTTDQDLIKDGVQAIDNEFLEFIVKNPSCEEVEVEKICNNCGEINCIHAVCSSQIALKKGVTYKIIIPNEESKQEFCDNCNNDICCCIVKNQETLKEYLKSRLLETKYPSKMQCAEIGAKWQAERSYSEEEVKNIISKLTRDCYYMQESNQNIAKWFEQFKKK